MSHPSLRDAVWRCSSCASGGDARGAARRWEPPGRALVDEGGWTEENTRELGKWPVRWGAGGVWHRAEGVTFPIPSRWVDSVMMVHACAGRRVDKGVFRSEIERGQSAAA